MDLGLLAGLAEGVKQGVGTYQQTKKMNQELAQQQQQSALQKQLAQMQMQQAGYEQGPEGLLNKTEAQEKKEALGSAEARAKLLHEGSDIGEYDPETKSYGLIKAPGFKDLDKRIKELDIKKKEMDLSGERHKPPTKDQYAAANFAQRVKQAEDVFSNLEGSGYQAASPKAQGERLLPEFLGFLKSPQTQMQEQAERNFVNAVLRRESGAAISSGEFSSAIKQYFPRPGDSAEVLEQKKQNRGQAHTGLAAEGGNALEQMQRAAGGPPHASMAQSPSKGLIPESLANASGRVSGGGVIRVQKGNDVQLIRAENKADLRQALSEGYEQVQ